MVVIRNMNLDQHNLIAPESTVFDEENFEYVHYFTQAIRAHKLYNKDDEYVVRDGKVEIVDEFTGRILEGRRYSDGLHQAIEAKEHVKIAQRNRTMATVTFQNFFRMYTKLSGMTGTAATEAVEFQKIYKLDTVVIPTNLPVARVDEQDEVYLNEEDKWNAIVKEIREAHTKGQPVLVGTVSVEKSEHLSALLTRNGIKHEVLNAKNHAREALIIAEAGAKGAVNFKLFIIKLFSFLLKLLPLKSNLFNSLKFTFSNTFISDILLRLNSNTNGNNSWL